MAGKESMKSVIEKISYFAALQKKNIHSIKGL